MTKGSDVLAFTPSFKNRPFLKGLVPHMRATAGMWMDWMVCLGAPSERLSTEAHELLDDPERMGIQYLLEWTQNRGQHYAFKEALDVAKARGYKWLLRIDDDIRAKTKGWLTKLISHCEELKLLAGDEHYRMVVGPKIVGLKYPINPIGLVEKGQKFQAEIVRIMGGACRLHPMELLERFEPSLYSPLGRGDPERMAEFLEENVVGGMLVRFPGVRMVHHTSQLEARENAQETHERKMSLTWCYLGPGA